MSKNVYLLGAGASYGKRNGKYSIIEGLPIMNEIKGELNEYKTWLLDLEDDGSPITILRKERPYGEVRNTIVRDIELYMEALENYPTIDSLAKALYENYNSVSDRGISCSNLYGYLKFLLSSFFLFEQNAHMHDSRYDKFLKRILTPDGAIPDSMYFLTWNYDMQLELSYRLLTGNTLPVCIPIEKEGYTLDAKVFKINGSANYYNVNHMDCMAVKNKMDLANRIFNQFAISHRDDGQSFSSGTTDLYFSWEKEVYDQKCEYYKKNTVDAEILVIIGYSFPDVNAKIDLEIINSMPKLQRIYVQDKYPQNVIQQMIPLLNERLRNCIEPVIDVTEFYIPV